MNVNHQIREIDGYEVKCAPLPYGKASRVYHRLLRVAGPLVGALANSVGKGGDIGGTDVGVAFGHLADRLTFDDFEFISSELFDSIEVKSEGNWIGLKAMADQLFRGHMMRHHKFVMFALEVNFADFLGALKPGEKGPSAGQKSERLG